MSGNAVTLIAALIAALVSVVNLYMTAMFSRRAEMRVAHRELLSRDLNELASAITQAIAVAHELNVIATTGGGAQRRRNWLDKANTVTRTVKTVRPRVRYQLWGLDEGLRTLARVPDWVNHYVGDRADGGSAFVDEAGKLGRMLDEAIRRSYQRGTPPGRREGRRVDRQAQRVRQTWERARAAHVGGGNGEADE